MIRWSRGTSMKVNSHLQKNENSRLKLTVWMVFKCHFYFIFLNSVKHCAGALPFLSLQTHLEWFASNTLDICKGASWQMCHSDHWNQVRKKKLCAPHFRVSSAAIFNLLSTLKEISSKLHFSFCLVLLFGSSTLLPPDSHTDMKVSFFLVGWQCRKIAFSARGNTV